MRRGSGFTDFLKAAGILLVFCLPFVIGMLPLWVTASAVTSGVKTLSDDCGKRYPVEAVLGGNWFCPEVEDE